MKRRLVLIALLAALAVPSTATAAVYTITHLVPSTAFSLRCQNASWASAQAGTGATVFSATTFSQVGRVYFSTPNYLVFRCFIKPDLSGLPEGATITDLTWKTNNGSGSSGTNIVSFYDVGTSIDTTLGMWSRVTTGTLVGTMTLDGGPESVSVGVLEDGTWFGTRGADDYDGASATTADLNARYAGSGDFWVTYTLPLTEITNLSIEPTVTLSGPISIAGTVPVSFDTTALAQAIVAALPTGTAEATATTGTVPVTIEGIGTWTSGAIDAMLVMLALSVGAAAAWRFGCKGGPGWTQ